MANTDMGQNFGWDEDIPLTESEFVLFDPGEYDYTVKAFERGWFDGSQKMAPCNMAKMTLTVTDGATGQRGDVFVNLMLNSKVMFRITQFFKSCGLVSPDAGPDTRVSASLFAQSIGRSGRVKLKHREYNGRTYNDVDEFVKPTAQAAPAPAPAAAPQQFGTWGGGQS